MGVKLWMRAGRGGSWKRKANGSVDICRSSVLTVPYPTFEDVFSA